MEFLPVPEPIFVLYELTFAILTPALICGSFADRLKFGPMLVLSLCLSISLSLCLSVCLALFVYILNMRVRARTHTYKQTNTDVYVHTHTHTHKHTGFHGFVALVGLLSLVSCDVDGRGVPSRSARPRLGG